MPIANPRNFLAAAGFAMAAAFMPVGLAAQSGQPITLIVPYGAGGLVEGLVREIAENMTVDLKQPVVVENRPGSNGIIGATMAANAKPDGLTYFVAATGPLSLNVLLRDDITFSLDSFDPVGTMMGGPLTVTVPASLGVNSIEELQAFAKNAGRPMRYQTLGPGSVTHLFGLVFQETLGSPLVDVSYDNNTTAIVDVIAGQLDLIFATPIDLVRHHEAGDVRILAITAPERDPGLPNLPTTTELGFPELVSSFWFGFVAPAGTPAPEIERFSAALQRAMSNEALQKRMRGAGMQPQVGGPEAMQAQLDFDQKFWGAVISANNIVIK